MVNTIVPFTLTGGNNCVKNFQQLGEKHAQLKRVIKSRKCTFDSSDTSVHVLQTDHFACLIKQICMVFNESRKINMKLMKFNKKNYLIGAWQWMILKNHWHILFRRFTDQKIWRLKFKFTFKSISIIIRFYIYHYMLLD